MSNLTKYVTERIKFFLKGFAVCFIIVTISGKFIGFTPMHINPLTWNELFNEKILFILMVSTIIPLLLIILKLDDKK